MLVTDTIGHRRLLIKIVKRSNSNGTAQPTRPAIYINRYFQTNMSLKIKYNESRCLYLYKRNRNCELQ